MSHQNYRYFTIPFDKVPSHPDYTVWFARWSAKHSAYVWSKERPQGASCTGTRVVAASDSSELPPDATVIIQSSIKCIDPPLLPVPSDTISDAEFQAVLTTQLTQSLDIRSL